MLKNWLRKGLVSVLSLALTGTFTGCSSPVDTTAQDFPNELSEARLAVAKVVDPTNLVTVDILQLTDPNTQNRAYPLGKTITDPNDPNKTITYAQWTSKFGGAKDVNLANFGYEMDVIAQVDETDYIIGLAYDPYQPVQDYTALGITFAAVNPFTYDHVRSTDPNDPGHYFLYQAMYPSNDDKAPNRSLIDLSGGDVAIMVKGIKFNKNYTDSNTYTGKTHAIIGNLGEKAYLLYMRDNAYLSGKFFNMPGVVTGGPAMGYITPDKVTSFNSAQVNGLGMTQYLIPSSMTDASELRVCPADPNLVPSDKYYSFLDLSNQKANGDAQDGLGGFLFVIRKEAFQGQYGKIIPDPSVAVNTTTNVPVVPPASGYNEPGIKQNPYPYLPPIDMKNIYEANLTDNRGNGSAGVQAIGISVLFMH